MNKETESIFFNYWRECLHAHYLHVVRTNDHVTEPSLRQVLLDAGVSEAEIETWYQEATHPTVQDQEPIEEAVKEPEEKQLYNPTLFDF